jgi:hypothetical protein
LSSDTAGVPHPAKFACLGNWSNRSDPSALGLMSVPLSFQSLVVVVTQPANCADVCRFSPPSRPCVPAPVPLLLVGVGQPLSDPPEPLSDVGRADARSAEINRPAGVARSFQVSLYKVEPTEAVLACNLLTSDDSGSALLDEPVEGGP